MKYTLVSESDVKSRSVDKVINKVIRILSASGVHPYLCSGEMGGGKFCAAQLTGSHIGRAKHCKVVWVSNS